MGEELGELGGVDILYGLHSSSVILLLFWLFWVKLNLKFTNVSFSMLKTGLTARVFL